MEYDRHLNHAMDFLSTCRVEIVLFLAVVFVGTALYLALTPIPFVPRWVWKSLLPLIMMPACYAAYMLVCDRSQVDPTYTGDPIVRLRLVGMSVSALSVSAWVLFIAMIRKRTSGTETQHWEKGNGPWEKKT